MSEVQVQSVSHRHQAIADWMLARPEQHLGVLAQKLGYTQSWLSVVIHSTMFKEYFERRRRAHEDDLRTKITGAQLEVTLAALEKLRSMIESDGVDGRLILDTAERIAQQCGFSPRPSARAEMIQEVSYPVPTSVLHDARARMTMKITRELTPEEAERAVIPVAAAQ